MSASDGLYATCDLRDDYDPSAEFIKTVFDGMVDGLDARARLKRGRLDWRGVSFEVGTDRVSITVPWA